MAAPASRLAGWIERQWWHRPPTPGARLLQPLAALYGRLAARQRRRTVVAPRPGVPVVVVGNLVAGGAGKTPTVIAVVQALRAAGWTPGVVSRGYGRAHDGVALVDPAAGAAASGDEPLLIRLRTGAPVCVGRDRVAALQALRTAHPEVDLVVADDGLQHHRLPRDVQVVVFDERGVGNGLLLPAGPLREPLPDALPPATLVLYNAPAPTTPLPGSVALRRLAGVTPLAGWWAGAPAEPLARLQPPSREGAAAQRLHAVAGIASPARFFAMLTAAGLVFEPHPLPDHAGFDTLPWPDDATDVVLTEKDAVKLPPQRLAGRGQAVWVATLDFVPPAAFVAALLRLLPPSPALRR